MSFQIAPRGFHCTVLIALIVFFGCGDPKPAKEDRFLKMLAADPRIENISIEGDYEDFALYNVYTVSFSIRGKPDSHITLLPFGDADLDPLRLLQIGSISPLMMEYEPRLGWVTPRSPALGNEPDYRPPLPWNNMDLPKLVSHYDEVLEYFSKWPRSPDFKTITTDGGIEVRCSIDPADASTMRKFTPPSTASLDRSRLEDDGK
jgi:hypothetical protein